MTNEPNIIPRKDLQDRAALVTGAASGIGLAITKRLLQEGAKVALWDFNVENLEKAKKMLCQIVNEERIFLVRCDITKEDDVVAGMKSTVAHFGKLNIAVNNAGVSVSVPSDECTLEQWNWVMNVNCTGSFLRIAGSDQSFQNTGRWRSHRFQQQRQLSETQQTLFSI